MQGNPILNRVNQRNNGFQVPNQSPQLPIQQIKNLMKQMRGIQNPQAALLQKYPVLQNVFAIQQKNGVSLQQIAELLAQQQGVNLNDIIRELQS